MKQRLVVYACLPGLAVLLAGCEQEPAVPTDGPSVTAVVETTPVASSDDAADDPAVWVHPTDPAASLVLGTDKQAGLYAYRLDGTVAQFLPAGRLNNVDLRQGVVLSEALSGDIAAASNRSDSTVTLFAISPAGQMREIDRFASEIVEPYGLCTGLVGGAFTVFVAYKTGDIIAYRPDGAGSATVVGREAFDSQLEGCVFDDALQTLYVGEEARGIWRVDIGDGAWSAPVMVDQVDGDSGITADVEGLALFVGDAGRGWLVASSQGNHSYAVYERERPNRFVGRFAIADGAVIDAAQETDGIEVVSQPLGQAFPEGLMIAQDGFNGDQAQNFKLISWRDVAAALNLVE